MSYRGHCSHIAHTARRRLRCQSLLTSRTDCCCGKDRRRLVPTAKTSSLSPSTAAKCSSGSLRLATELEFIVNLLTKSKILQYFVSRIYFEFPHVCCGSPGGIAFLLHLLSVCTRCIVSVVAFCEQISICLGVSVCGYVSYELGSGAANVTNNVRIDDGLQHQIVATRYNLRLVNAHSVHTHILYRPTVQSMLTLCVYIYKFTSTTFLKLINKKERHSHFASLYRG